MGDNEGSLPNQDIEMVFSKIQKLYVHDIVLGKSRGGDLSCVALRLPLDSKWDQIQAHTCWKLEQCLSPVSEENTSTSQTHNITMLILQRNLPHQQQVLMHAIM